MDTRVARELVDDWTRLLNRAEGDPLNLTSVHQGFERAQVALRMHLEEWIPEGAPAASVIDDNELPRVAALHPNHTTLAIVGVQPFPDSARMEDEAVAICRLVPVARGVATLTSQTHRTQGYGGILSTTEWTLSLGPQTLSFRSENVRGEEPLAPEAFGRALCAAVGFERSA